MKSLNIVIVEDDERLRASLIELVELNFPTNIDGTNYQIQCIGFKNGLEFMKYTQNNIPIDVVLLDIEMPVLDGIGVLKACKEMGLNYNFVMYSAKEDPFYIKAAKEFNLKGYLHKNVSNYELFQTMVIALRGGSYTCKTYFDVFELLESIKKKATLKELEVAHYVNENFKEKEIATILETTEYSIKSTKKRLKQKYGFKTFDEVLAFLKFKKIV